MYFTVAWTALETYPAWSPARSTNPSHAVDHPGAYAESLCLWM
jgi:hypothetical protein